MVSPAQVRAEVVAYARSQLGVPYRFGGESPKGSSNPGLDCSGLTQLAAAEAGVSIPRTSQEQWAMLPHVSPSQVLSGDLVFFVGADPPSPGHVGIVVAPWMMINAPHTGVEVQEDGFNASTAWGIVGYARIAPAGGQVNNPINVTVTIPELSEGSSGKAVLVLQHILDSYGYEGKFDGEFGAQTEGFVRAFQTQHRLTADGVVGLETWTALLTQL